MKRSVFILLFILIGVMLGAQATQFVEIDTGGPYYVVYTAGTVTVGAYLNAVLVAPHQPLQQGDQRIAISYPPFYNNNPSWVTGTVTYSNNGTYYTIHVPYIQNSGNDDRQGYFRIDIQTWDAGEYAWVSSINPSSWYYGSIFQYRSTAVNPYQATITGASNNSKITIPAGVFLGSLVIQNKSNVTISGAGMYNTTIKGAGPMPAITIINCTNVKFQNMKITSGSSEFGGGVKCDNSTATIENCLVKDNNAYALNSGVPNPLDSNGGAFYLSNYAGNNLTVKSSIVLLNFADYGETAFIQNGTLNFNACTLLESATSNYITYGNSFSFWNSIVSSANTNNSTFNYCCSYNSGVLPGSNNLNTDPMFVNAANGDYSLQEGSPCMGTGYLAIFDDSQITGFDQNLITILDETQDIGGIPFLFDRYAKYSFTTDAQGNWICFPVIDDLSTINVGGTNYRADIMKAFFMQYISSQSAMTSISYRWYGTNGFATYTYYPLSLSDSHYMQAKMGYKVVFNQNSTMNSIHGYQATYNTVVDVPEPNTENWIGYFIPETQTPQFAFGSFLDELYSIKTKNWSMDRVKPKRGSAWIISPNMTLSYGEMVVVKKFGAEPGYPEIDNFIWQRIGSQQQSIREETEYFSYTKELDYTPVYVQFDSLSTAQEIAVMVDNECYGAAVVDNDLVMIQAFIESVPDGSEIQLVTWDGAKSQVTPLSFNVYDQSSNQYLPANCLVKQACDFYSVKLGADQTGDIPEVNQPRLSNHPNPFNPTTTISYSIPKDGEVKVNIFNIKGQLVKILVCESKKTGVYSTTWNGDDQAGNRVSSGLYFARMETSGKTLTNKMIMLK